MAIPEFERQHVLQAIEQIDRDGYPEEYEPTKFYVRHEGKDYPPKYIISLAIEAAHGIRLDHSNFTGGYPTNSRLEKVGFDVVEIGSNTNELTFWHLLTLSDEERQHAGNTGYDDDLQRLYRWDSTVSNSKRLRSGDIAVLRSKAQLLGVARIQRIEQEMGTKTRNRCPSCGNTGLKRRKEKTPRYKCDAKGCLTEFDDPKAEQIEVTQYVGHFGDSFVATPDALSVKEMSEACVHPKSIQSMREMRRGEWIDIVTSKFSAARLVLAPSPEGNSESLKRRLVQAAEDAEQRGDFDASDIEDAREKQMRAIALREGQPKFRAELLQAYEGRCAISGCDVEAALEAAHIVPYKGPETNHPQNGLLLRGDLHKLFDRGLLAIDVDSMTVVLHPGLTDSHYAALLGRIVDVPAYESVRPSGAALRQHRLNAGI